MTRINNNNNYIIFEKNCIFIFFHNEKIHFCLKKRCDFPNFCLTYYYEL
jgi:hypothetical protein